MFPTSPVCLGMVVSQPTLDRLGSMGMDRPNSSNKGKRAVCTSTRGIWYPASCTLWVYISYIMRNEHQKPLLDGGSLHHSEPKGKEIGISMIARHNNKQSQSKGQKKHSLSRKHNPSSSHHAFLSNILKKSESVVVHDQSNFLD